ncbi:MAG: hypothetical protein K8L97_19695 [Anaerolineae bacterium]|nr:hypothetical protein [Anaerolineae bacterium]
MLDTLDLAAIQADLTRRISLFRRTSRIFIYSILGLAIFHFFVNGFWWVTPVLVLVYFAGRYLYFFITEQQRLKAVRQIARSVLPQLPPALPSLGLPWNALVLIVLTVAVYEILGRNTDLGEDIFTQIRLIAAVFLAVGLHTTWVYLYPLLTFRWLFHGPFWRADYEGAMRRAKQLKRLMPWDMRIESVRGNFLLGAGRDAEAAGLYYSVLPFFQNDRFSLGAALCNLGYANLRQGRGDTAFTYIQAAAQIMPENPDLLNGLAFYYLDQSVHLERGLEIMEYIMSTHPRPKHNRFMQLNQWREWKGTEARLLALLGKNARADAAVDEMFGAADPAFIPGLADANLDAGFVRKTQGDLAAAREHFQRAIDLDPNGYNGRVATTELNALDHQPDLSD